MSHVPYSPELSGAEPHIRRIHANAFLAAINMSLEIEKCWRILFIGAVLQYALAVTELEGVTATRYRHATGREFDAAVLLSAPGQFAFVLNHGRDLFRGHAKAKNRQDLIKAVEKCFGEYDAERMAGCCESLITSYNGCLTTLGVNTYSTHGGRSAPFYWTYFLLSSPHNLQRISPSNAKSVVDRARAALVELQNEEEEAEDDAVLGRGGDFDASDSGSD
jgi:hypothetical protein